MTAFAGILALCSLLPPLPKHRKRMSKMATGRLCLILPFSIQLIFKVVAFSWVNVYVMMPNNRDFSQDHGHCYFYFILLVNADPPFFFSVSSLHEQSMLEILAEDSKASMPSYPLVHGENNHFVPSTL